MVFALHSKVVQNLAAVVEFVHSIIKTLNCCGGCAVPANLIFLMKVFDPICLLFGMNLIQLFSQLETYTLYLL